jgi:hypothetical protein
MGISSERVMFSLASGLYVAGYIVRHGMPSVFGSTVIIGVIGSCLIPTYVAKRLLVDYWLRNRLLHESSGSTPCILGRLLSKVQSVGPGGYQD